MDKFKHYVSSIRNIMLILKRYFISAYRFIIKCINYICLHKPLKIACGCVSILLVLLITLAVIGVRFSYNVIYNGRTIGQIASKSVYASAKIIAETSVTSSEEFHINEPELKLVLSVNGGKDTATELSCTMLRYSANILQGYKVSVDGETKLFVSECKTIDKLINDRCESYYIEGSVCSSKLENNVEYVESYFDKSLLSTVDQINEVINAIDIVTVEVNTTQYDVPFEKITEKTSDKLIGYKQVTTNGVNGVNEKQIVNTYVNGVKNESIVAYDKVISNPINQITLVGNGVKSSKAGFIWPLSVKGYITSYWGDGRNHKGIDIAAVAMTDICAVKDGTVEYAGWLGRYGNCVLINHGNGIKTRYAHAKVVYAKVGQKVSQGDVIAGVGTTGDSTGNHLHFEVLVNGTRVNPASYIGLK